MLSRAASVLQRGGLVAFPTETVYGLGAVALNPDAVRRIFEAKGRPAHNPVIVHVADTSQARSLVFVWPEAAELLAKHFWPGPLTLVLPKAPEVPDEVTAGGPTVAIRVPANPVALALIRATGQPIAAPSANISTAVSPTRAEHVLKTLNGRIDMVLDGGPCRGGIESTVLALNADGSFHVLRPGLISRAALEAALHKPVLSSLKVGTADSSRNGEDAPSDEIAAPLPSPGMLERHYAPTAPLTIARHNGREESAELARLGYRIGWLAFEDTSAGTLPPSVHVRLMPRDPDGYAAQFYAALHELDALPVDRIVAARLPEDESWAAVRDRLQRASVPA